LAITPDRASVLAGAAQDRIRMMKFPASFVALAASVCLAVLATAEEVAIQPLAGKSITGELQSLSGDKIVVTTAEGELALDAKELKSLRFAPASALDKPSVWLELLDGSQLLAISFVSADGRATVELVGGVTATIPTRSIRHVRFREQEGALADQWKGIVERQPEADLLVIRKMSSRTIEQPGLEPRTVSEAALDELDGVVLEVGPQSARFEFDGDEIPVSREKIDGIVFFHPVARELPAAACRVVDAGGSTWTARSIALKDDQLELVSTAGVEVDLPLAHVQEIDFSSGNVKFLGELEEESTLAEASFQPKNMTATFKQLKAPRWVEQEESSGGPALSAGGEPVDQGLSLSGRTRLSYQVPEGMQWFRAQAALDDTAGASANLTLRILADNREVLNQTFSADEPRKLRNVEIDVSSAGRLSIVVEDGSGLDIGDQLILVDARFTK
jgi:hypothetical protein